MSATSILGPDTEPDHQAHATRTSGSRRTWARGSRKSRARKWPRRWRSSRARTTSRRSSLVARRAPDGKRFLYLRAIQKFLASAPSVDVHIVTQEGRFMTEHAPILVVDDEPQITRVLRTTLCRPRVMKFGSPTTAQMALRDHEGLDPHLIITDLSACPISTESSFAAGYGRCRRFRCWCCRCSDQEQPKIEALDAGADDYVTKPFSMNELLARVRGQSARGPPPRSRTHSATDRDGRLPHRSRRIPDRAGQRAAMSNSPPRSLSFCLYLAQHPHRVIPHRTLLAAIWGGNSTEQPEYLRVFIGQLRKKIEPDAAEPLATFSRNAGSATVSSRRPYLYEIFISSLRPSISSGRVQ